MVYITAFNIDLDDEMHASKRFQIAYLKADKAFTKILSEYANFADVFSLKLATKLSKHIKIKNKTIELVNN